MKKFIQWLAKKFNANITVEKIVTVEVPVEVVKEVVKEVPVEVIKEVTKEVPVEVVKEVPVEVIKEVEKPIYVISSTMSSDIKLIEGDVAIDGDLTVNGNLFVNGAVSCYNNVPVKNTTAKSKRKGGKK